MKVRDITLLFVSLCMHGTPLINLEDDAQDIVIETKQIILADYPHAFNPSIVRWHGRLLLSFRVIPNPAHPFASWLGLVWLDEQFNPCSKPQRLSLCKKNLLSRAEDGRLITIGSDLYLIYSDNVENVLSKGGFRVHTARLVWNGKKFIIQSTERITSFPGVDAARREKNWVPFEYGNQLFFSYSITPHIIFQPLLGTGHCELCAASEVPVFWSWGELRGGTPALFDDGRYLAFFHSSIPFKTVHSQGQTCLHYMIGAYLFSSSFPFTITHISKKPLIGPSFYTGAHYTPYWKPLCVVFPCGFVKNDRFIWLAYGRQDHEIWIAKIDKCALYASLQKIT